MHLRFCREFEIDLGDDPEGPLGAEKDLAQIRTRRGTGRRKATQDPPARQNDLEGEYEVLDVPVAGRELSRGTRGHPTADGGDVDRLGEMAEREAPLTEQPLALAAGKSRLHAGGGRLVVDLEQRGHPRQVHHQGLRTGPHAATHARTQAIGDDRNAFGVGDLQNGGHLLGGLRKDHCWRRRWRVTGHFVDRFEGPVVVRMGLRGLRITPQATSRERFLQCVESLHGFPRQATSSATRAR